MGVREVQRALSLSSPSVAHHHLEKLMGLKLVDKDRYGRYIVAQRVDVGVLQAFTKIGSFMLPRFLFYAFFFTTLLITYILRGGVEPYSLAFGVAGTAIAWYETIRAWRKRPI